MSVFVVIDDWGYDGTTDIGVADSLDLAKAIAARDALTERSGGRQLQPWVEDPKPFMAIREWCANCGGHHYVIREHELQHQIPVLENHV